MQQKVKKIPARRCVGCSAQRPKRELVRVVRSPQGEIALDLTGKKPGRGAYLCPDPACLTRARKSKRLERAFDAAVPPEVYEALAAALAAAAGVEQPKKEASPGA